MTGAEVHTLAGAYVLDAVSDAERDVFAEHLGGCPTCAQEGAELRATAARLGSALAVIPRDTLRTSVFTEIDGTSQLSLSTVDVKANALSPRRWMAVGVVTAAVLFAGITIGAGDRDVSPTSRTGESVLTAADASSVTGYGVDGGSVTAVVSRVRGKVVLTSDDLPRLDNAHSYQVWLTGPRGPQSAGLPDPGDREVPIVAELPADVVRVTVTIEPLAGSPRPTTASAVVLDLR